MNIIEQDKEYIAGTYKRFPVVLKSGKGAVLVDENGREYIDLGSGIAVNSFGAADDKWVAAVTRQAAALQHTSNLYYSEPCVKLAELLCKKSGMKKVFFSNSGAEANECAIKTARKHYFEKTGREGKIITLKNSFHGRTVTTLSATGQDMFHKYFGPFTDGFVYVEPGDCEALQQALCGDIAAVMYEPIQGEGGVNPLDAGFIRLVESQKEQKGYLTIADEVQTGNGRTGKYFAVEHFGVTPDIITTAKGLGGGLPIGATLFGEKTADVLKTGDHGSTFGGNPVAAAGALSIVERIDDELLTEVNLKGEYIKSMLSGAAGIISVSGMGLMLGVKTERPAGEVAARCLEKGVLVLTAKDKIRLLPPLNITYGLLDTALDVLKEATL